RRSRSWLSPDSMACKASCISARPTARRSRCPWRCSNWLALMAAAVAAEEGAKVPASRRVKAWLGERVATLRLAEFPALPEGYEAPQSALARAMKRLVYEAYRVAPGANLFALLNDPLVHARFGVPDGHYIGATRGNVVVDWLRRGATVRDLVEARGDIFILDPPGEFKVLRDFDPKLIGNSPVQALGSIPGYDPAATRSFMRDLVTEMAGDALARYRDASGKLGSIDVESSIRNRFWGLKDEKSGLTFKEALARALEKGLNRIFTKELVKNAPGLLGIVEDTLNTPNFATDLVELVIDGQLASLTRDFAPYISRIHEKGGARRLRVVDGDAMVGVAMLQVAERVVAAAATIGLLKVAINAGMFDGTGLSLGELNRRLVGTVKQKPDNRINRLALAQKLNIAQQESFTTPYTSIDDRTVGLLSAVFELIVRRDAEPLAKLLQGVKKAEDLHAISPADLASRAAAYQKNMFMLQMNGATLNQIAMAAVGKDAARVPFVGSDADRALYAREMGGMVAVPLASMYNPEFVGDKEVRGSVHADSELDLLLRSRDGTRVILEECKFIQDLHTSGSSQARESLWTTARAGFYSTKAGTVVGLWLVLDASESEQSIKDWVRNSLAKDPRYVLGPGAQRSDARLSWNIGVKLPVKLDPVQQERLRGYIAAELAKHQANGDLATYTVVQMLKDIARAHPELRIPANAEPMLVLNRDANGNLLRTGTDPLDIQHGGANPWPSPISPISFIRPDSSLTLQEFKNRIDSGPDSKPISQWEGFFVDTRTVVFRVVQVNMARAAIVQDNLNFLSLLCHLAGVQMRVTIADFIK
ncbi:MAG: hypothetical protein Q6365_009350, partial [Candidatus Sigynarchaeota archaeon]